MAFFHTKWGCVDSSAGQGFIVINQEGGGGGSAWKERREMNMIVFTCFTLICTYSTSPGEFEIGF